MSDISSLQALINKRAEDKLDAEMGKISKVLQESRLLKHYRKGDIQISQARVHVKANGSEKFENVPLADLLYYESSIVRQQLREKWLPVYIQEETALFLKQFDEMQEQMADLTGQVEDLQNDKQDREY